MNLTLKEWVKVKGHMIIGLAILTNQYVELKIMFLSLIDIGTFGLVLNNNKNIVILDPATDVRGR